MRCFTASIVLLTTGVSFAVAQSVPPCCSWTPGDRVRLLVADPYGAPGLPAQTCGTVVLCDPTWTGPDALLVSWDGWTWDNAGTPDTTWWLACDQVVQDATCQPPPVCGNGMCEAGETAASCPGDCPATCCNLNPGDPVVLAIDNPNGAIDLLAGSAGHVVCCDPSDPVLPLFVSWDNWAQGTTDAVCSANPLPTASGWWIACTDLDLCPNDPAKTDPGVCGCGVADTDTDSDGTPDCNDACPDDPNKTAAGACGCGVVDTDSDSDGTPDCNDACPDDPAKTAPGACGCGAAETDTDTDGTPDCNDGCPADPGKIAAGLCGCGVADTDTDSDGTPDCNDTCPADPAKTAPGSCGCGKADRPGCGTDGGDACPSDPSKTEPGVCGCGVPDTDTDADGTPDCNDTCPADPAKTAPGSCGCGKADTPGCGTDGGDACPNDPNKTEPGVCGCGVADVDTDGDQVPDCVDNCPADANPDQADSDGNGIGDACDPQPAGQDVPNVNNPVGCGFGIATAMPACLSGLCLISLTRRRSDR